MARPSRVRERRTQILDAFEGCVAERGLDATSLDATASAAGMGRQLLLHYFGSRAALVEAAVARISERYRVRIAERLGSFEEKDRLEAFLDWMFLGDFCEPASDALLGELLSHSRRSDDVRAALGGAYRELEQLLVCELESAAPEAQGRRRREAAFLVMSLCFGAGDLLCLEFPKSRLSAARTAAGEIVARLRE